MKTDEPITLSRDCEAIQIPSGTRVLLPRGTLVRLTQSLGGTYTVVTEEGFLFRIAAKEADSLGEKFETASPSQAVTATPACQPSGRQGNDLEKLVWDQLRSVFDPEIPVNVVDLGLVYLCRVTPLPEGGNKVEVKMTLTAPGCGMGGVLQSDAQAKIQSLPEVKQVNVEMVVDPPWNPSRMSEAAKLQLGML